MSSQVSALSVSVWVCIYSCFIWGGEMTDKELLELAAKAAGVKGKQDHYGLWTRGSHEAGGTVWNPLTDDGDAMRLAVKLGIMGRQSYNGQDYEAANKDPYAATRRAIVRAAAEIGKGMK
jgi:hypothetical protein